MDTQQQITAAQNEILQLKEEIKQSTDELQHTLTSVSVLYQVSSELSGVRDKATASSSFVASICKLFSVDVGIIIELDKASGEYKTLESIGLPRADIGELSGKIEGSAFAKIDQEKKPLRLKQPEDNALPGVVRHLAVKSALFVPITPTTQPELILLCCRMYAGEFLFEEERVISILGQKLAETLDRIAAQKAVEESLSLVKTTIESMADGIVAVNADWKITLYNKQYTSMWNISQDIMDTGDVMKVVQLVSDQLSDPVGYIKKVDELRANPDSRATEVLEFKDGRVFERNSVPQRINDKVVGRVWNFHDVTSMKQAEKQLESRMKEVEELNGFMVDRELKMIELKNEIKELQARA